MKNKKKDRKIEMALGGQTLHRVRDGFKVRRKSAIDADRVKTDPAFTKTMQNATDFSTAAKAGRMLREALNTAMVHAKDGRMSVRLTGVMRYVLKTDMQNLHGQRSVQYGDLTLLQGFQFNIDRLLAASLMTPFMANIDRVSGDVSIIIPEYRPAVAIAAPPGATHYVLHTAVVAIDFDTGKADTAAIETTPLPLAVNEPVQTVLSVQLPPGSDRPLFLVLGIYFLQSDNGEYYPVGGRAFNALSIVTVVPD